MKWPDDYINKVICGDCLEVMKGIPDGAVDAVITDPPYGVNYAEWDSELPPQSVLDKHLSVASQVVWFGAASRVLDFANYQPRPRVCVWAPTFTLSKTGKDGMFYRWHPLLVWTQGIKTKFGFDVLRNPCDGHNAWKHPATKPLGLMRKLVSSFPDSDIILDPFAGSGSTLVAAKQLGRRYIGIEINPEYCKIAEERLSQGELAL